VNNSVNEKSKYLHLYTNYQNQRKHDAGPAVGLVSSLMQQQTQVDEVHAPFSHLHV